MQQTKQQIIETATNLVIEGRAFINGEYVSTAGGSYENSSPIDGKLLSNVSIANQQDVDKAASAAKTAFNEGVWSAMPRQKRKKILLKFADLIEENRLELALLDTLDMGKPIALSYGDDLANVLSTLRWYAEAVDKYYDEVAPYDGGLALVTHEPIGVVAAVVPWNFPLMMAMWKVAPALSVGNSVILKPAEQSPSSAIYLGKLAKQAGIPDGVFQVLPGLGPETGQPLGLHPDVDVVAFTGSTLVGKLFLQYAGQSNGKRVYLECGGKSPILVFDSCKDLDFAADMVAAGIFYNAGQVCIATSRLYVQDTIYDTFMEKLKARQASYKIGNPLDPQTNYSVIVDDEQCQTIMRYIEAGKSAGATVFAGGEHIKNEAGGVGIAPTIFTDTNENMSIVAEEIFGPVLAVGKFSSLEEGVALANNSVYGLFASAWTDDLSTAHYLHKHLKAGTVGINNISGADVTVPFGGFKQSGNGRDKSQHALDKYTELKTTVFNS